MENNLLIIGGNSGIGLDLVKSLDKTGYKLFVASRNNSNLKVIQSVEYISFDASEPEAEINGLPETLDGLVYFPGTITLKPFHRLKLEDFKQDWQINFLSAVNVIQQAFPALKKGTNPSLVMVSTVAVQTGMNFHSSISSAKGAVEGLVRALAAEFAPTIRVNAIAPSLTDTPLAERLLNTDAKKEGSANRHPLKRFGKTSDHVNAIQFLLSEQSSWITGQILKIDGGLSIIRH